MDFPKKKWSDVKFVTDDIQELCDKVKRKVEEQTQKEFEEYKAVFYRILDILVLHYVIKVYVGGEYLHLWVIQCASTGEQLMGIQQHHKWDDPLKPFDENN